jgi:hypothetical protein
MPRAESGVAIRGRPFPPTELVSAVVRDRVRDGQASRDPGPSPVTGPGRRACHRDGHGHRSMPLAALRRTPAASAQGRHREACGSMNFPSGHGSPAAMAEGASPPAPPARLEAGQQAPLRRPARDSSRRPRPARVRPGRLPGRPGPAARRPGGPGIWRLGGPAAARRPGGLQ